MSALASDRPANDVDRVDIAGALPEHADVGIAHQPCIDPVLDIAVAAARTPCDSRDRLTCSIICLSPLVASPMSQANAPSRRISPEAIERVPSLSFRRTIR